MNRLAHRECHRRGGWPGILLWTGVCVLLIGGCGTLDNQGGPGDNNPPEVFLANVPADRTEFAESPMVYWYGTDDDGRIVRYDYAVVLEKDVDSVAANLPGNLSAVNRYIAFTLNDQFPYWISVYVDSVAHPDRQEIKLYASPLIAECDSMTIPLYDENNIQIGDTTVPVDCVSDTIPQYVFVRAIDDRGAVSKIKYRAFTRRNHWPTTRIPDSFDRQAEYISLAKLSGAYTGIRVVWAGSDDLDVPPPATPDLDFHWRVFGPYDYDADNAPTLEDTLGMEPAWESANEDTLKGVWVKDTTAVVYDLWRVVDRHPDPQLDTSRTRTGWFMVVVRARDDAYISSDTAAHVAFKAIYPRFERAVMMIDDTWYSADTYANPAGSPTDTRSTVNQAFLVRMLDIAYATADPTSTADTLEDFWWRSKEPEPGALCRDTKRVRCGNFVSLEMLAQHRLVIHVSDDLVDPVVPSYFTPPVQRVLRQYLDAGGMVWMAGRHCLLRETETCQTCKPNLFNLVDLTVDGDDNKNYCLLASEYFDIEAMYYPAWRRAAMPISSDPLLPASNDEFVAANLIATGTGLPSKLEVDPERIDNMYFDPFLSELLCTQGGTCDIVGVPDVNFLVRGSRATPLYVFESWRPLGPVPPEGGKSDCHGKPVMIRMVGPSRDAPLYKTAYTAFPLYFLKEEQSSELVKKMVEWFMLPFSQS